MTNLTPRQWLPALIACFSGIALLAHIFIDVPLYIAFGLMLALAMTGTIVGLIRTPRAYRRWIGKAVLLGAGVGLAATAIYDGVKWGLSQWDPSPYNPFEAIKVFGVLLLGADSTSAAVVASPAVIIATGTALHILNGTCFALGYLFLFGRRGWWAGILWGLFLETFQFTLYPSWLGVKLLNEFYTISAVSHIVYGVVLGIGCKWGLERLDRRFAAESTARAA